MGGEGQREMGRNTATEVRNKDTHFSGITPPPLPSLSAWLPLRFSPNTEIFRLMEELSAEKVTSSFPGLYVRKVR